MNLKGCNHFNRRLGDECKAVGLTKRDIKNLDISTEITDTTSSHDVMRSYNVGAVHVVADMKDGRQIRFYYFKRDYVKKG